MFSTFQLFPEYTGYRKKAQIFKDKRDFFMDEIQKHKDTLDEMNPRDFIDVYLIGMSKGDNEALTYEDLAVTLNDMFGAGTETSSTTLKWTLLYLTLYPGVQERCREEILR